MKVWFIRTDGLPPSLQGYDTVMPIVDAFDCWVWPVGGYTLVIHCVSGHIPHVTTIKTFVTSATVDFLMVRTRQESLYCSSSHTYFKCTLSDCVLRALFHFCSYHSCSPAQQCLHYFPLHFSVSSTPHLTKFTSPPMFTPLISPSFRMLWSVAFTHVSTLTHTRTHVFPNSCLYISATHKKILTQSPFPPPSFFLLPLEVSKTVTLVLRRELVKAHPAPDSCHGNRCLLGDEARALLP